MSVTDTTYLHPILSYNATQNVNSQLIGMASRVPHGWESLSAPHGWESQSGPAWLGERRNLLLDGWERGATYFWTAT